MITESQLKKAVTTKLSAAHTQVTDTSGGCGQAFEVLVVSSVFAGKNKLARHRIVNQALKSEIASLHAFTQKNFTPEEWEDKQKESKPEKTNPAEANTAEPSTGFANDDKDKA